MPLPPVGVRDILLYWVRWAFTLLFGSALAVVFTVGALAVALFCITGALTLSAWRSR